MWKIASKLRLISIILLISVAFLNFLYLSRVEKALRESELLGASAIGETVSFLFKTRVQSLLVTLHSLNYARIPISGEGALEEWLLVLYRAYSPLVLLAGFIDEGGRVVETYPRDDSLKGKDVSSWRPFKMVKLSRVSFIGERITTSWGKEGIGVFVPLFGEDRAFKGVFFYIYDYHILTDALRSFLESSKSPWNFIMLDGEGNLIYGDEKIASSLLKEEWGKGGSFEFNFKEYLFLHFNVPLAVASDWHLFLYAPVHLLSRNLINLFFLKYLPIALAILISFFIYYFHKRVPKKIVKEGGKEPLKVKETSLEEGEREESLPIAKEEDLRRVFPGALLELDTALNVLYFKGLEPHLEEIDRESLKRLVRDGGGYIKLGERTYYFRVVPKEGGFFLFGEDRAREKALLDTLLNNLDHLLVGRLLKSGCDPQRVGEFLLSEEDRFKRVNLRELLSDLKGKLSLRLRLELKGDIPSPWINPLYLKRLLLYVILRLLESGKDVLVEATYLRDKADVSLKVSLLEGAVYLSGDEVGSLLLNSLALRGGVKRVTLIEGGVALELPLYPELGEK